MSSTLSILVYLTSSFPIQTYTYHLMSIYSLTVTVFLGTTFDSNHPLLTSCGMCILPLGNITVLTFQDMYKCYSSQWLFIKQRGMTCDGVCIFPLGVCEHHYTHISGHV